MIINTQFYTKISRNIKVPAGEIPAGPVVASFREKRKKKVKLGTASQGSNRSVAEAGLSPQEGLEGSPGTRGAIGIGEPDPTPGRVGTQFAHDARRGIPYRG